MTSLSMSGLLSFQFHKWLVLCWIVTSNSIATENCQVINSTIELLLISYHTNHCYSSEVSQMGRIVGCSPLLVVSIATFSFLKAGPQRGSFEVSSTLEPPGFVSKSLLLQEGLTLSLCETNKGYNQRIYCCERLLCCFASYIALNIFKQTK